jgi:AmpD protein
LALPSTAPAKAANFSVPAPEIIRRPCTHYDDRPDPSDISLLVIHNISLPPATFNTPYIDDFFGGRLDCSAHPYFARLAGVRVSAHCVIYRDGRIWQYVPFDKRAWHAGLSLFDGRDKCNDFSIGIELEGADDVPFTEAQYQALSRLCHWLLRQYPALAPERILGHSDIASGRKTDPGPAFDWSYFQQLLAQQQASCAPTPPAAGEPA